VCVCVCACVCIDICLTEVSILLWKWRRHCDVNCYKFYSGKSVFVFAGGKERALNHKQLYDQLYRIYYVLIPSFPKV